MTERLPEQIEFNAHLMFGRIIGSFTLENMPDVYLPEDVPAEFIEKLVGVDLPIRAKRLGENAGMILIGDTVEASLRVIQERNVTIPVFGLDALAELDKLKRNADADKWSAMGGHTLIIPAEFGQLRPLPRFAQAA